LVASDLHLGLEHELWLGGVSIPSQTKKILSLLKGYLEMTRPDRLRPAGRRDERYLISSVSYPLG